MDYYNYMLANEQDKYDQGYYDAPDQNAIEWNGTLFPYTKEDNEIFFDYQVILGYEWDSSPIPGEDNEWYHFQEHAWKVLGKPEQVVDATFPFLAFEEPEPQELEDIPIEYF